MPDELPMHERRWLAMADPASLSLPAADPAVVANCLALGLIEPDEGEEWRLSAKGERFRLGSLRNGNPLQPAGS
jgi:hypothetical protein